MSGTWFREGIARKGELYKVKVRPDEDFFGIYFVEEDGVFASVEVTSLNFEENYVIDIPFECTISPFDEKITDPAEQAYWLLRFENCRTT